MVKRTEQLHEGKAKIIYATDDPNLIIQYFKDDATAFNALKKGTIVEKGIINNKISSHLYPLFEAAGVATHFVEKPSDREMICKKVDIIPLEVVVRNIVAGSLSKRLGIEEGERIPRTLVEFYYKDDDLGDPLLTEDHVTVFNIATAEDLVTLKTLALKVNDFFQKYLAERNIDLVDYKLEFGRTADGEILLADEVSPDSCRLWDSETKEKLDKDRFRRDMGKIEESYRKVALRICGEGV